MKSFKSLNNENTVIYIKKKKKKKKKKNLLEIIPQNMNNSNIMLHFQKRNGFAMFVNEISDEMYNISDLHAEILLKGNKSLF